MKKVIKQNINENSEYNNKIEAFNELDKMDIKIKNDIDYKEETYKVIKDKYESISWYKCRDRFFIEERSVRFAIKNLMK